MLTQENIKRAFDTFDLNSDGLIDIEEFKTALPTNLKRDVMKADKEVSFNDLSFEENDDTEDNVKW